MHRFEYDLEKTVNDEDKTFTDLLDIATNAYFEIFKPIGLEEVKRRALDYEETNLLPDSNVIEDQQNGVSVPLRYGFSPLSLKKIERTKRKEVNFPTFPNLPFENTNLEYNLFPKNPGKLTDREQLEMETDVMQSVADKCYRIDVFWHEPQTSQNIDMMSTPERGFRFRKEAGIWKPINQFYQTAGNKKTTLEVMKRKDKSDIFDEQKTHGLKDITAQGLTRILTKEAEVRQLKHSRVSAVNQHGQYTNIKSPLRN